MTTTPPSTAVDCAATLASASPSAGLHATELDVRFIGRVEYAPCYAAMQSFTQARQADTPDQLWLCEHPPVYTQGLAGRAEHLLAPGDIPVIPTTRGGQITYHGPGQVVAYPLLDLQRRGYFAKEYVYRLEEAVIRTLAHFGITGHRVAGAPGIYVRLDAPDSHALLPQRPMRREPGSPAPIPDFTGLGKIAALGIKISRHCTYHGLALNVDMDLRPYGHINPCGYPGLVTTDLSTMGVQTSWDTVARLLAEQLTRRLAP